MKVRQLLERHILPSSGMGRAVSKMAGGTVLAQLIVVVSAPVITRLYSPEDFGVLAVYASLLGIVSVIACLGLEVAIPLPEEDDLAANLLAVSFVSVFVVVATSAVLLLEFGDNIFSMTNSEALGPYIWAIPLGALTVGLFTAMTHWSTRLRQYGDIAISRISQSVLLVATQIGIGVAAKSPFGLIAGQVVSPMAGSATLVRATASELRQACRFVSVSAMKYALSRYRRFPMITAPGLFVESAGQLAPPLLLASQFGPAVTGLYLLSQRVIGLPIALAARSVSQVYIGEGASRLKESPTKLQRLYFVTLRKLFQVAILPSILLAIIAPTLFAFVFGAEWRIAGEYTRLLIPALIVNLLANPVAQTLNLLERQGLQFAWSVIRLVLVTGALLLAAYRNWTASESILALSLAMVLAYLTHIVLCWHALGHASRNRQAKA